MANSKKRIYTFDDYVRDRQARTAQSAVSTPTGVQYARSGSAFSKPATYVTSPEAKETTVLQSHGLNGSSVVAPGKSVSFSPYMPSNAKTSSLTANTATTTSEQATVINQNQVVQKPLTEAEIAKFYFDQAQKNVYDILNRRFKYNAKESPLYSILQKQSEREAERAAGQAYARSVANTGGYGSSYATLSAEEARRKAMESMDDQQLAIYQAARQEFLDERESAVDWYNQARVMYENALKDEEAAVEASGVSKNVQNFYNAAAQVWDGKNEEQVKSALRNQGATDEEIEATVSMLKNDQEAIIKDDFAQFELSPTLGQAQDILESAKATNSTEYGQKVSKVLSKSFEEALGDPNKGYSLIGVDQATWDALSDEDKASSVLDAAGNVVKEGILQERDYLEILKRNFDYDMTNFTSKGDAERTKGILENVEGLMELKKNKYLSEEAYEEAIKHVISSTDISDNFYKTKVPGKGEGYQIALQHNFRLNSGETDALFEIIKVYSKLDDVAKKAKTASERRG